MAGIGKEEMARREGMSYALRIAREKGIEALEEELRYRNALNVPIGISRASSEEFTRRVKENTIDTMLILSCVTLRDQFDFGQVRLQRFADRFCNKAECLMDDYTSWEEQIEILKEECGINFNIRRNDENIRA